MKKSFILALSIFMTIAAQAQFASQVTFEHSYTKGEIDSILHAQGLPQGVLTTIYDVRVYKVIYHTVGADSLPTTASGLMVVPQGTSCEVPILAYEHNNIFKKTDAPSFYHYEWFVGLAAASLGLITVMPDGLGLGSGPGTHPFLQLQSEATPVIDMIRAAKEVVDTTGASNNSQLFLAGIAEGGYSALAAHQYIQTYLGSEMHVTGTGSIAGYYDLSGTMVNMILSDSTYTDQSYLPALFLGYNKTYNYATADSDIFVYPYDSIVPPLYNGTKEAYQINAILPTVPKHILQPSIIDTLQNDPNNFFTNLLRKNDAFNWAPTSPVNLFFCTADEIVPAQNAAVAYTHFVANGSTMVDTFNVGATYDHALCGQFSTLSAIQIIKLLIFQPITASVIAGPTTSATSPNGTVMVTDSLGNPPYSIQWSTGDTTAIVTGLTAGTYYVTVTDQSHCTLIDSGVVVSQIAGINDLSLSDINVYPNPTQGQLIIDYHHITDKIESIELLDINGNTVDAPAVKTTTTTTLNLSANAKGVYTLRIRSQSGSELRRKVVLL
jgi:hypothetical protein